MPEYDYDVIIIGAGISGLSKWKWKKGDWKMGTKWGRGQNGDSDLFH